MANILTDEAAQGYITNVPLHDCPYLATSDSFNAWHIGAWMKRTGRSMPHNVRGGRGNTYHVNGMKVRINTIQGCTEIERIA